MIPRAKYLKDTCSIVRTAMENLTEKQRAGLEDLAALNQPLYRAYLLKEQLRSAIQEGGESGCALVTAWIDWAAESDLPCMVEVSRRVAGNIEAIHAALRHRISNARTEAFNTRLQLINRRPYGPQRSGAHSTGHAPHREALPALPGRMDPTHDCVT